MEVIQFLEDEELPPDSKRARKVAGQLHLFTMVDGVLYFVDPKQKHRRRAVVPSTFGSRSWRKITVDGLEVISLADVCTVPSCVTGGGKVCISTPRSSPRIVLSAPQ